MTMDNDILQDYLSEARELLEQAQNDTLALENGTDNDGVLASLFRAFHTLKGGAGFLEAEALVGWTHHLEDLLDKMRSHTLKITSARIDAILRGIDVIKGMLDQMVQGEILHPGPADLGQRIIFLADPVSDESEGSLESAESLDDNGSSPEDITEVESDPPKSSSDTAKSPSPTARSSGATPPIAERSIEQGESTIRIEVARLDAVMNQIGELVLLRNRFLAAVRELAQENEGISRISREMDLTVNDMQGTVMRLRMQPCKRLFQQLPRVVRDVSRQLHKQVNLITVGEDVEIDKTVVDSLSAPLVHLVRNSMDHGIEIPADRKMLGKPETATLRVAAMHLGDKVRIEVSDDGQGIDQQLVTHKAIEKGLVTAEEAARLSDSEAIDLIFRPGFSTNDRVTEFSGRGVGMDVVKETTQQLRGRLDVNTHLGQGTTIAMEFPLSLAVLPVLYLRLRGDVYALPVSAVESLLEIEPSRIHRLQDRNLYHVNSTQMVPILDLGSILHSQPLRVDAEPTDGILTERGLLIVSDVLGNEDSVVKPVDFLPKNNWYQGATITGKGEVVLILDIGSVFQAASSSTEVQTLIREGD